MLGGTYIDGNDSSVPDEIWLKAMAYAGQVEKELLDYDNSVSDKKRLRIEVAIAWVIIDQAKYYYIVSKAKGKVESISDDEIGLLEALLLDGSLDQDKAMSIQKYFDDNYSETEEFETKSKLIRNVLYLLKAVLSCDKILFILNCGISSGKVAYYTKHDTLMKMLPDTADSKENVGKFAVMHVAYMNDPNEGKILNNWIYKNEGYDGRKKANYPYVFIKCFTTLIDDLPMWEMYGDHAKGYCIIIDLEKTMEKANSIFPVYNVCYLKKSGDNSYEIPTQNNASITPEGIKKIELSIADIVEVKAQNDDDESFQAALKQLLSRITYLFKNADYSHESEKRIIYTTSSGLNKRIKHTKRKDEDDIPMLYVLSDMRVCVDEIILGPKYIDASWKVPYLQESLEKMSKEIGLSNQIRLSYSSIEYK